MDSQEIDDKGDIRNVPKHIIKELICTYKSHFALWQIKNKDLYGNRTLKYKGHRALVNVWKKYDEDAADIKMLKNKIQSLRGSFLYFSFSNNHFFTHILCLLLGLNRYSFAIKLKAIANLLLTGTHIFAK